MSDKKSIYQQELENLEQSKEFLKRNEYSKMDIQLEFKKLVEDYEDLISQVKIITKISDRLQNKLNRTNDKLEILNDQLNEKNIQLKETIDALTAAKIGRRASTIILIVAVILFVFSEVIIEPYIEGLVDNNLVGLGLKLVVAILIKPGESLIENTMMRRARKKQLEESEYHTE